MLVTGAVITVRNGRAAVRVPRAALHCAGGECHGCSVCKDASRAFDDIPVDVPPSVKVGDAVQLQMRLPNEAVAALCVFGLPLVGLLVPAIGAWAAGGGSAVVFGSGGAGLVVGILAMVFVEKRLQVLGYGARFAGMADQGADTIAPGGEEPHV